MQVTSGGLNSGGALEITCVGGCLNSLQQLVVLGVEGDCEGAVDDVPIDVCAKVCSRGRGHFLAASSEARTDEALAAWQQQVEEWHSALHSLDIHSSSRAHDSLAAYRAVRQALATTAEVHSVPWQRGEKSGSGKVNVQDPTSSLRCRQRCHGAPPSSISPTPCTTFLSPCPAYLLQAKHSCSTTPTQLPSSTPSVRHGC